MNYLKRISQEEHYQLPSYPEDFYSLPQEEKEPHLRDYWKIILKRRWIIIATFLIALIVTAINNLTLTPIYRSTATIQINRENPQIFDLKEIFAFDWWDTDYYKTQHKLLESRSLAGKVVQNLKLSEHPEVFRAPATPVQEWKSTVKKFILNLLPSINKTEKRSPKDIPDEEEPKDAKDSALVSQFLGHLKIEPVKDTRIVKIHFDSYDPKIAAKMSNAHAEAFIQQNIESRFSSTQQAKVFLTEQLQDMKAKVEKADEALQEFGSKHGIISLDDQGNITMQRLADLNNDLVKAESERVSKEVNYRQMKDQRYLDSLTSMFDNKHFGDLKQTYIQLETQYTKLLETLKPDHPEMVRLKKQMALIEKRVSLETEKEIQRAIEIARVEYESSRRKEALIRTAFERQKAQALDMKEKAIRYNILKRESDTNKEIYANLLQKMKETGISAAMTASNIQVVDQAEIPKTPYKPDKQRNLLLAVVVGLFLGVGLAFFFEYLDNTIKTTYEVEQLIRLPSFGMIPEISNGRKKQIENGNSFPPELITFGHPKSMLSEAYRNIRTSILLSFSERPPKTIVITSPCPSEGKTTTVINTAIVLAQTGAKVMIIDADLRNGKVQKVFGKGNRVGLSNFLSGNAPLISTITKTEVPNLHYISSGPMPPNPSELIGSNLFKSMIETLVNKFDHIIIDSPPVLGFSDSVILSASVDGVILVVAGGKTPRETLQQTKDILLQVNAKILGVVINRVNIQHSGYGYYYHRYHYYYQKDEEKKELPYN